MTSLWRDPTSRRAFLASAGAALLAACTPRRTAAPARTSPSPTPSPSPTARASAAPRASAASAGGTRVVRAGTATTEGGRARQRNVLDRFAIDFSLCMYCGICIEVCPFDALFWAPDLVFYGASAATHAAGIAQNPFRTELRVIRAFLKVVQGEKQAGMADANLPENADSKKSAPKPNSQKEFEKAVAAYKKLLAASPKDDVAQFNLGRAYNKLNQDDDAEEAFRAAVKLKANTLSLGSAVKVQDATLTAAVGDTVVFKNTDSTFVQPRSVLAMASERRSNQSDRRRSKTSP